MTDLAPSLVRTLAPLIAGPVIARFGFDVTDPDTLALATAVFGWLYYVLVRLVETKWPTFGYLLGIAKAPAYSTEPSPSPGPGENVEAVVVPDEGMTLVDVCWVVVAVSVAVLALVALGWLPR